MELTGLTPADLADYLPRTTRKIGAGGTAWHPVLTAVRDHPDRRASRNLGSVLTTPLMVGLARTIYSDTPDHDPAALLDTERFPTPEAIEEHLLGNLVPTVYRHQPDNRRFHPDRVGRWLRYLARHQHRLDTYDLAWWQLGASMRLPIRMLVVALTVGLVLGLADILVEGLVTGAFNANLIVYGILVGGVAGPAFGLAHGLVSGPRRGGLEPSRVRIRIRGGGGRPTRRHVLSRLKVGFVVGLLFGLGFGTMRVAVRGLLGLGYDLGTALVDSAVFGFTFGAAAGLMIALIARFEAPLDVTSVGSPLDLLHANRRAVLIQMLVFGPAFALAVPLVSWFVMTVLQLLPLQSVLGVELLWTPRFGLLVGSVGGVVGCVGYLLSLTAWGQWALFARLLLPLTGRLPWAVHSFLDDAYRRGVLRRAGAVYQFRHARLQDHLSASPPPRNFECWFRGAARAGFGGHRGQVPPRSP